jgi:hypothetical protein
MIRLNKYFLLAELVPPEVYYKFGEKAKEFLDPALIHILYKIREMIGRPMTINTWHQDINDWSNVEGWDIQKHRFRFRGLRPPECNVGAAYSQHRFGRAADFDVKGWTADETREWIKANAEQLFEESYITGITLEEGVSWVHLDIRNSIKGPGIQTFIP